ncbi:MAG: transposase, partial [Prevotellaceae bacterium]|nr:transposase [Prevotellaceae bacterium]
MHKTIGSSSVEAEVEKMYLEGKEWIHRHIGQVDLFAGFAQDVQKQNEAEETRRVLQNIEHLLINGTEMILDRV